MVDKICDMLMQRVELKMPEVDEERAEIIRYGFELMIGEFPKIVLMFIIAILLGKIKYFLISIAIICPYRIYSGGVHLKTHIGCFFATTLLYLGNVYMAELLTFPNIYTKYIAMIIVYAFAISMICLYAPADTDTVPILRRKDRNMKKIISIIIVSIVVIYSLITKNTIISNLCIVGIFIQTITITKGIYKIFNVKLGYLEYKKSSEKA